MLCNLHIIMLYNTWKYHYLLLSMLSIILMTSLWQVLVHILYWRRNSCGHGKCSKLRETDACMVMLYLWISYKTTPLVHLYTICACSDQLTEPGAVCWLVTRVGRCNDGATVRLAGNSHGLVGYWQDLLQLQQPHAPYIRHRLYHNRQRLYSWLDNRWTITDIKRFKQIYKFNVNYK